jgi:hypothetical protein
MMLVRHDTWVESVDGAPGHWVEQVSEVSDRVQDAEDAFLQEFLSTCDEDERVEYFQACGIELGSN